MEHSREMTLGSLVTPEQRNNRAKNKKGLEEKVQIFQRAKASIFDLFIFCIEGSYLSTRNIG